MKTLKAFLILTILLFGFYACKKTDNTNPGTGSVVGRWNVVNVETGGVNHAGQAGDYFEFTANGALYTKEGKALDTFTYAMRADTAIVMTPPPITQGLSLFGSITTFTAHSLIINGPYPISPGGPIDIESSIVLSR
jgi:hypothetical protein